LSDFSKGQAFECFYCYKQAYCNSLLCILFIHYFHLFLLPFLFIVYFVCMYFFLCILYSIISRGYAFSQIPLSLHIRPRLHREILNIQHKRDIGGHLPTSRSICWWSIQMASGCGEWWWCSRLDDARLPRPISGSKTTASTRVRATSFRNRHSRTISAPAN